MPLGYFFPGFYSTPFLNYNNKIIITNLASFNWAIIMPLKWINTRHGAVHVRVCRTTIHWMQKKEEKKRQKKFQSKRFFSLVFSSSCTCDGARFSNLCQTRVKLMHVAHNTQLCQFSTFCADKIYRNARDLVRCLMRIGRLVRMTFMRMHKSMGDLSECATRNI